MIYAGIGSRETPKNVLENIKLIAARLGEQGWILRTGGAPGADTAFFDGAFEDYAANIELYLPWDGFNEYYKKDLLDKIYVQTKPSSLAFDIAAHFHPAYSRLKQGAKKLMARNSHQILGADLETPVDCIICWTPNGSGKGGTGQAIRIAQEFDIPVVDLGNPLTGRLISDILK